MHGRSALFGVAIGSSAIIFQGSLASPAALIACLYRAGHFGRNGGDTRDE
jgi:hypothetical protein